MEKKKKQNCVERKAELRVSPDKDFSLSNKVLELGWSSRIAHIEATRLGLYTPALASQVALVVKNLPANSGDIRDAGSIPGSGRSLGGGHGNPLQFLPEDSHGERSLVGYSLQGHRVRHN